MNPNKKVLLGTTAAMVVLSPFVIQQAVAATADIDVNAEVLVPIVLSQTIGLNFGNLAETAQGTVELDLSDTVSTVGGGLKPAGGTTTSGSIQVNAPANEMLRIQAMDTVYDIVHTGGTGADMKMVLDNIKFSFAGHNGDASLTVAPTGISNELRIGAQLTSMGAQVAGSYTGSIKVEVAYQ